MKPHNVICLSIMALVLLPACNKTTTNYNSTPSSKTQDETLYSESKYGPFDESEFSEWMDIADFQVAYEALHPQKKGVFYMEGRNHKGLSQYRVVIRDRPENVARIETRNFMDEKLFWSYGSACQKKDYERISLQLFKDSSGVVRHQAIWFKYKEPIKQQVEQVGAPNPLPAE